MSRLEAPYAGLILPDAEGLDPAPYLAAAEAVLARLDRSPDGPPQRFPESGTVYGGRYGISVTPEPDSDYGPRVVMEVIALQGAMGDDETAARLLSDAVLAALDHSPADILEWYSPDVLIDREDFIRLRSYVSPRRLPQTSAPLPQDDTEAAVDQICAHLFEADGTPRPTGRTTDRLAQYVRARNAAAPEQRRMGAAGWAMTATLSFVCFPVAIFMSIIGLVRGMDFRLVTQATAVTMLFLVLVNTDRLQALVRQVVH
ncbi:hypothetical protein [Pseudoponticoccus marisrubri]|uniref:Uncharacterized protein n=1 Tax=Pseudoponticoccus marisrubri TaxID=1685382 RepID=A0A0W7WEE9_9RHOB|nr:hypothetical protein [Pseudoponticoccus marisrubri]KUF09004.1 hypothetical protein AVJ23_19600 [Pseudoponticoccus marisrubri]